MNFFLRFLKGCGRLIAGFVLFIALCMAWIGLLFVFQPWISSDSGEFAGSVPIAVTSGATNKTRVIRFRKLAEETKTDPSLVPWPSTVSGAHPTGDGHATWNTVGGKPWQFEVVIDERDYLLESRYRLEGEKPVLVESRTRDPGLGFQGVILAVISWIGWRIVRWWRRRRVPASPARALPD